MTKARTRKTSTKSIVNEVFNGIAGDLAMAAEECDQEAEIHVDDFMDFLFGTGKFGSWEEWDAKRSEIRKTVCDELSPSDQEMIYCG